MIHASVSSESHDTAEAVGEGTDAALKQAGGVGFETSQVEVPADTSNLRFSGYPPEKQDDGSYEWGYTARYAAAVEKGTKPHYPPIGPLLDWARRVLGDESAAYAVQRKIAEKGTDPQPFVAPGIRAMRAELRRHGITGFIEERIGAGEGERS